MDQNKNSPFGTFTIAEYTTETRKVVDHAAANGTAVVVAADGRPLVVIDIPTTDLPVIKK